MGQPSESEIQGQIKATIKIFNEIWKFGSVNATNLTTLIDTLEQLYEGEHVARVAGLIGGLRGKIASAVGLSACKAILDPMWIEYAKTLGYQVDSAERALARIYLDFIDNSKSVNSRAISFGSPAFSGATGTGTIKRLVKDERGHDIEIGYAESFVARCIKAQGQVDRFREVFEIFSSDAAPDNLEERGSNVRMEAAAKCGDDSLLLNPSFSQGTSTTSIDNWTVYSGSVANTSKDTTNYYAASGPSDSTPTSLSITGGNAFIQQKIKTAGITLLREVPYYFSIFYNRSVGSATGSLVLRFGADTATVADLSAASAGWQELVIANTYDKMWYMNAYEDDFDFAIDATITGGTLKIDHAVCVPMFPFRGQYYQILSGDTPFALNDKATWSDTIASDAIIQRWIAKIYGFYLPHNNSAAETWTDP